MHGHEFTPELDGACWRRKMAPGRSWLLKDMADLAGGGVLKCSRSPGRDEKRGKCS